MKKKLLAFVMAATMVFSLAACGSSSSNDSSSSSDSSDSDSAQSGDEVQTFKLGSIGPLTGDAAIYGQAVVNGAQLAVDEINASDSKIKFEFKGEDDEATAKSPPTLQPADGLGNAGSGRPHHHRCFHGCG